MPSLRALECFVAVLDDGSFSRAARRLFLSQPALSHHLAALEREVGTALLERHPAGARPTAAGRAVEPAARQAVDAARRVVSTGRAAAAGRAGHVRLGCAESMTGPLVAPYARRWLAERPDVSLDIVEAPSADTLAAALRAGDLDVAVGPPPSDPVGEVHLVGEEDVLLVCPPAHPLARADGVGFTALAEHPVVHYAPENGLAAWLDALAAREGAVLHPVTRVRHATSAAQLAAAGLGAALVPRTALPGGLDAVVRRLDPPLVRRVVVQVARPQDALAQAFARGLAARGMPGDA
jgi:DNA-binding transcriptional LysR family regulator